MSKVQGAVKTVSFIAVALLFAKALGFAREILFYNMYGTTEVSDAFICASRLPALFFDIALGAAVLSCFTPIFNRFLQQDRQKAFDFANSFLNIILIISAAFCIIGMVIAPQLVEWQTDFVGNGFELTVQLLRIMLPTVVFTASAYVFVGILQSLDEFNIPAIISLFTNIAIIAYLFFFNDEFGVYGLSIAFLIGWSLQVAVQIPSLIKKGYRYRPILKIKNSGLKDAFVLAVPALVGSWAQPVCMLINSAYASVAEGGYSALDAANKLNIMVVGVFVFAITNYILPKLSQLRAEGDNESFGGVIKTSIMSMFALIIPIACAMLLFSDKIVNALFVSEAFNAETVSLALKFFAFGMIALGINEILGKGFFAMENGKIPMVASLIGICVDFICAYLLFTYSPFGLGGLALATSIALTVISIIYIIKMQRKIKFIDRDMLVTVALIAAASLTMMVAAFGASVLVGSLQLNKYIELGIIAVSGIAAYGAVFLLTGIHKRLRGGMV